jgi:hypothetical protein
MYSTSPLSALRQWLEANNLDGMIVPRADAWQSEYCAPMPGRANTARPTTKSWPG